MASFKAKRHLQSIQRTDFVNFGERCSCVEKNELICKYVSVNWLVFKAKSELALFLEITKTLQFMGKIHGSGWPAVSSFKARCHLVSTRRTKSIIQNERCKCLDDKKLICTSVSMFNHSFIFKSELPLFPSSDPNYRQSGLACQNSDVVFEG